MAISLPPMITTLDEAKEGVYRFQKELRVLPGVVDLLSSFQSWYAIPDESGQPLFAPSKFIGYAGLTATAYREVNRMTDGRVTEAVLSRWFSQPSSAVEQALLQELAKFLNRYGKQPNKRARVSTLGGASLYIGTELDRGPVGPSQIDAMMVIYRMLPPEDQREFRRRINKEG